LDLCFDFTTLHTRISSNIWSFASLLWRRKVLVLVRQYCKSIGICIAILIKNLYWYWQYFFQAVLVLVLPILCKSIVNNPVASTYVTVRIIMAAFWVRLWLGITVSCPFLGSGMHWDCLRLGNKLERLDYVWTYFRKILCFVKAGVNLFRVCNLQGLIQWLGKNHFPHSAPSPLCIPYISTRRRWHVVKKDHDLMSVHCASLLVDANRCARRVQVVYAQCQTDWLALWGGRVCAPVARPGGPRYYLLNGAKRPCNHDKVSSNESDWLAMIVASSPHGERPVAASWVCVTDVHATSAAWEGGGSNCEWVSKDSSV